MGKRIGVRGEAYLDAIPDVDWNVGLEGEGQGAPFTDDRVTQREGNIAEDDFPLDNVVDGCWQLDHRRGAGVMGGRCSNCNSTIFTNSAYCQPTPFECSAPRIINSLSIT